MTSAGRFWCGYLLCFVLCVFSIGSHAGYYARTTVSDIYPGYCPVGQTSQCYLTVGMAIAQTCAGYGTVTALDVTAKTYSFYSQNGIPVSGTFDICDAVPLGSTQPAFSGGVTDPAVLPTGVAGGASSGASEEMFDTEVFTLASGAALLMFVTGFGIGLVIQLVRRLRTP